MQQPTSSPDTSTPPSGIDYEQVAQSKQFVELRRRQRGFVFPMAAFFLIWYLAYVLVAAYAPDFMAIPVFGNINLGLLLGLAQFVTTFGITMWYVSFANRRLDPMAHDMRVELADKEANA